MTAQRFFIEFTFFGIGEFLGSFYTKRRDPDSFSGAGLMKGAPRDTVNLIT